MHTRTPSSSSPTPYEDVDNSWSLRPTSCVRVYYYYYYRYPRFTVRFTADYFEQHCFRCPVFVPARPVTVHLYGAQAVIPLKGVNFISADSFYNYYYLKFRRFRLPTLSPIVVLLVKAVFWWQSVLNWGPLFYYVFIFFSTNTPTVIFYAAAKKLMPEIILIEMWSGWKHCYLWYYIYWILHLSILSKIFVHFFYGSNDLIPSYLYL